MIIKLPETVDQAINNAHTNGQFRAIDRLYRDLLKNDLINCENESEVTKVFDNYRKELLNPIPII